jgi:cell fate (sporulation/competence/biofilm development) regulator YlbF (YheA/YmcA/DUF963 family)
MGKRCVAGCLLGIALLACGKTENDFTKARAALEALIGSVVRIQAEAIRGIEAAADPAAVLSAMRSALTAKQGINPGIDAIVARYPALDTAEEQRIIAFMQEKVQELQRSSEAFEKAVDGAIRKYAQDQEAAKPLILALREYQQLGQ